jgi:hypothetical protein
VFVALKKLGVESEMVRFPEEFHGLSRTGRTDRRIARLNHILRWFDKYLIFDVPGGQRQASETNRARIAWANLSERRLMSRQQNVAGGKGEDGVTIQHGVGGADARPTIMRHLSDLVNLPYQPGIVGHHPMTVPDCKPRMVDQSESA